MSQEIKEKDREVQSYDPEGVEKEINDYLLDRIPILKETKKNILGNFDFEQLMKEADVEYIPHNLKESKNNSVMLIQDEIKGLRGSRVVPIGNTTQDWRSNVSESVLLTKISIAMSILMGQNPEGNFKSYNDMFKRNKALAYSLWKRNWSVSHAKDQYELLIFDLAKYGWAIGRTYPRYIADTGKVLESINDDRPEKNKYKDVNIVQYNDVYRERLDPYKAWIDDMTNLMDPWSMNDWYYEKDYSWDSFVIEFGEYENIKYVKKGGGKETEADREDNDATEMRDDIITVGFYENRAKDLYVIRIPSQSVTLYHSPLPNDKKKLSCFHGLWNIRDPKTPYGIGIYEIIRNDKVLYDRMRNMTIDQLVMAIYPMLWYSGAGGQTNDGEYLLSPATIKQKAPGTTVEQTDIKYDSRGWEGVAKVKEDMDDTSGITPTLGGATEANTLGQSLQDRDSALQRLSIPLNNIGKMIVQDAYITVSWFPQIYSIPEIRKFANEEEIQAYVNETGKLAQNINSTKTDSETGQSQEVSADFFPTFDLSLEDRDGELIESKENRFFNLNHDIQLESINWEGMIEIDAKSIVSPSPELERQRKLELFNLIQPVIEKISLTVKGDPMAGIQPDIETAFALAKPAIQVLEIQDEKPKLWLPDELVKFMEDPEAYKAEQAQKIMQQQQQQMQMQQQAEQKNKLFIPLGASQSPESQAQSADTIVPRNQITNPVRKTIGEMGKV